MTDLEIYTRWLRAYNATETSYMRGDITLEDYDRIVRNIEERLGVDTWTVDRWHKAAGEGA